MSCTIHRSVDKRLNRQLQTKSSTAVNRLLLGFTESDLVEDLMDRCSMPQKIAPCIHGSLRRSVEKKFIEFREMLAKYLYYIINPYTLQIRRIATISAPYISVGTRRIKANLANTKEFPIRSNFQLLRYKYNYIFTIILKRFNLSFLEIIKKKFKFFSQFFSPFFISSCI